MTRARTMTREVFMVRFRAYRENAHHTGIRRDLVIDLAADTVTPNSRAWVLGVIATSRREGLPVRRDGLREAIRELPRPDLP